ncbi:MAG TPA: aminotransferase class V-fold PLP-dependent enzyme [Allosphingosinicella sp.]|nr:aminotransferase class V-fold PLP-dependent enzyme [Allosphingosinicella sp.]
MTNIYLDCNASTQVDPAVLDVVIEHLRRPGNPSSRTHGHGLEAKRSVQQARQHVADAVGADPSEVVFTSGATEANNLALLGLREALLGAGRRHIVASAIEHKAVLEPLERLAADGFEVTWVSPGADGRVSVEAILEAVRDDTGLVSLMTANNETGVIQPIADLAGALDDHPVFLHTDAAQAFGKVDATLFSRRIDLIAVSGHKVYAPQGVGALITRRRRAIRPPLRPLMVGGGQEAGLRPGTLPVALIAGLGEAVRLATTQSASRRAALTRIRRDALAILGRAQWTPTVPEDISVLPHVLHGRFPGVDSEALMVALKGVASISNGSACTSSSYGPSHVLTAMGLAQSAIDESIRISWSHLTRDIDWEAVASTATTLSTL